MVFIKILFEIVSILIVKVVDIIATAIIGTLGKRHLSWRMTPGDQLQHSFVLSSKLIGTEAPCVCLRHLQATDKRCGDAGMHRGRPGHHLEELRDHAKILLEIVNEIQEPTSGHPADADMMAITYA
jgi:hypothetical protein